MTNDLNRDVVLGLPKILLHEHLDCSLRPSTMLQFFAEDDWNVPANFPLSARTYYLEGELEKAAAEYQNFLAREASKSLANYVNAIVLHVLPLMQHKDRLARITRERVDDAVADGVVALELRFAPQLHIRAGLTLEQVMDAVVAGMRDSAVPVKLIICALRHEGEAMAERLADLAIKYKQHVGLFDLAGDEKANPGVLLWWAKQAAKVREYGIEPELHLWETDEPTDDDLVRLAEFGIRRLGHGMRGRRQEARILEVCPSSNCVTGQIRNFSEHPIDSLYREGKRVTVNTDGTLFTRSDLSNEYLLLNRYFNWGKAEFLAVNLTALEVSSFSNEEKSELLAKLKDGYC